MLSSKAVTLPEHDVVLRLEVEPVFVSLTVPEKLYAHNLARAAWRGTRIVMRRVSEESPLIFDFIRHLYLACGGHWALLIWCCDITDKDLAAFLEYAATFLSNLGNCYGNGGRKFVPNLAADVLKRIASISAPASQLLEQILGEMLAVPPEKLGYPDQKMWSEYDPGQSHITPDDIDRVSKVMKEHHVGPNNTRIFKTEQGGGVIISVLQASANRDERPQSLAKDVLLHRGDHRQELLKVSIALFDANKYAPNSNQSKLINGLIETCCTGNLQPLQKAQNALVVGEYQRVEYVMGFIKPNGDPVGIGSEWVATVGVTDLDTTATLKRLEERSSDFVRALPWADGGVNDGEGLFEEESYEAPSLGAIHPFAVCSSTIFEAADLTNYCHIHDDYGLKNVVVANCLSVIIDPRLPSSWIHPADRSDFLATGSVAKFITTAIRRLIGYGRGRLLSESDLHAYRSYEDGQTWKDVFGSLAETVEECRAILISQYLMDNKQLLEIFGYTDSSNVTPDDLLYTTFMNIGVDGLEALEHFDAETLSWTQARHQAHFTVLKFLLREGDGVIKIKHDTEKTTLTVLVNRSKLISDGKSALGRYACLMHVWLCTADVDTCKRFYERMSALDAIHESWRQIVCSKPKLQGKFVQPNTVMDPWGDVVLKKYEATNEGVIQSWMERDI